MTKKQIPIGLVGGVVPTVTTRWVTQSPSNYLGGHHFPMGGVMTVYDKTDTGSLSKLKEVAPPALTTFADDEKYNFPTA